MSVYNAISKLGYNVFISNQKKIIQECSHIILPGVGSYKETMNKIQNKIDIEHVYSEITNYNKPFLGICVGMQVLSDFGKEFGETSGLGWISGRIDKLSTPKKLPHIGWNKIQIKKKSKLLMNIAQNMYFYFVHSYVYDCFNDDDIIAETNYGSLFPCIINFKNIFGVQFHPEKSQKAGLLLLKNFVENF